MRVRFVESHIYTRNSKLVDVGLRLYSWGSPTTLSGEAQRVKLAKELSKRGHRATLIHIDEPTTGLHLPILNNSKGSFIDLETW